MSTALQRVRTAYGAGPLHLLGMLASFALLGYVVSVWGLSALWDPDVWWQSVLVWLAGAVIFHDLVLFPAYALADRLLLRGVTAVRTHVALPVSPLNYVRVPVLAVGLLFLLFFPGILKQGAGAHLRATGLTQDPFLQRFLLLTAVIFATSALLYAVRLMLATGNRPPGRRKSS